MLEEIHEDYLRSALFGLQDGLVSTTGVVVGISTGVEARAIIILAAFVAITVEASSMAAGQYSSEKAVHQLDTTGKHTDNLFLGAAIMFVAYYLAGLIPILPILFVDQPQARIYSVVLALFALFIIGFIKGRIVKVPPLRSAFELLVIGGIATALGLIVGHFLKV
jgi:VIT1/CCC1 family predicted Fe2+/Mn2+ transporter